MTRSIIVLIAILLPLALVGPACDNGGSPCGDCDDNIPCTQDACDRTAERCTHQPDHSICGLGFTCDLLQGCTPTAPCEVNADCDDHNACTFDVCDAEQGCLHNPNDLACDDGDACTANDHCQNGACAGDALTCDDQNACTDDSCQPDRGCLFAPNSAACDDGNPCTQNDTCTDKVCAGSPNACDDSDPCTSDSCDPGSGCQHDPNTAACDDGDPCTVGDQCQAGSCSGSPRQCGDDDVCTDDSCDPDSGCVFVPNTAPCDDGNPCTSGDACAGGICQAGTNTCACSDDGDCLAEEDGNPCNGTLICLNNACEVDPTTVVSCDGSADTDCQRNTCDPADGLCKPTARPDDTPCDDGGPCYFNTGCQSGQCIGAVVSCDDGKVCTDDACDPQLGCQNTANDAACDDGNPCTEDDACANGSCQAGAPKDCDDDNACTDDSCNPATGQCTTENNQAGCDDGETCTSADTCAAGSCQGGQEACCGDNLDNDGDGATDCDDPACDSDPACTEYQVDWCRLQYPPSIDQPEGNVVTVFGRLNILGLTNQTPGVDVYPLVRGEAGFGPDGSLPSAGGWTWSPAAANPGWNDASEPGNDEYMADLVLPAASGAALDYAFRFTADDGQSWVYCDLATGQLGEDGSQNGYQPANAGQMTVSAAGHDTSNWDFETAWGAGEVPEDFLVSSIALAADLETTTVGDGSHACRLTWTSEEDQSLRLGWQWSGAQPGVDYTLHVWVSDQDPGGALRPALDFAGDLDAAATLGPDAPAFAERTHRAQRASASASLAGVLMLEDVPAYWDGQASLVVDDVDLTQAAAFDTVDGIPDAWTATDPAAPPLLAAAPLPLQAAINDQGQLYVATSATESGATDKAVFVWLGAVDPAAAVLLPWGKSGQVARAASDGQLLALVAEESNHFCEWRRHNGADWVVVVAAACKDGAVLEGQIDLTSLTGLQAQQLAARLSFSAVRINTGDGGTMWSASQTPACADCDNDRIDPDETLSVHRARLLVGRVR